MWSNEKKLIEVCLRKEIINVVQCVTISSTRKDFQHLSFVESDCFGIFGNPEPLWCEDVLSTYVWILECLWTQFDCSGQRQVILMFARLFLPFLGLLLFIFSEKINFPVPTNGKKSGYTLKCVCVCVLSMNECIRGSEHNITHGGFVLLVPYTFRESI